MKKTLFISSLLAVLFPALLAEEAKTPAITITYTNYDEATGRCDTEVTYSNLTKSDIDNAGAVGLINSTESANVNTPESLITATDTTGKLDLEKNGRPLFVNNSVVNVVNCNSNYYFTADANYNGGVYGSRTINVYGADTKIPLLIGGIELAGFYFNNLPCFEASNGIPVRSEEKLTLNLYEGTISDVRAGFNADFVPNIATMEKWGWLEGLAVRGDIEINLIGSTITSEFHGCGGRNGSADGTITINVTGGHLNCSSDLFAGAHKGYAYRDADGNVVTLSAYSGSTYFNISGGEHGQTNTIKIHAGASGGSVNVVEQDGTMPTTVTVCGTVKGDTHLNISGGSINGSVYGGGEKGIVTGNTYVTISDGGITGSVYGGGESDTIDGSTYVTISGGSIGRNVYACGDSGSTVKKDAVVTWTGSSASVTGSVIGKADGATVNGETILNLGTAESAFTGTITSGKIQGFDSINAVNVTLSGANYLDGAALNGTVNVSLNTKLEDGSSFMTLTSTTAATLTYTVDLSRLSSLLGVGGSLLTIGEEEQAVSLDQIQWLNGGDNITVDWKNSCLTLTEGDTATTLSFETTGSGEGINSIVFGDKLVTTTASGQEQNTTTATIDAGAITDGDNTVSLGTGTSLGSSGTDSATLTTTTGVGDNQTTVTAAELTLTGKEENSIIINKETSDNAPQLNTNLSESEVGTVEIIADSTSLSGNTITAATLTATNTSLSGNTITTATLSGGSTDDSDSKLVLSANSIGQTEATTSTITNYKEVELTGDNTLTNTEVETSTLTVTGENTLTNTEVATSSLKVSDGKQTLTDGSTLTAGSGTVSGEIELVGSTLQTSPDTQEKITFTEGATLSGTGTVSGISMTGGTLRIGNSPGVLSINHSDFQGGEWKFCLVTSADWNGTVSAATHHSQLDLTGTTTVNNVRVSFYYEAANPNGPGYVTSDASALDGVFAEGDSLTLITGTQHLTGSYTVDYASLPALASGYIWETDRLFSTGCITVVEEWQEDVAMVADSAVSAADIASGFSRTALAQAAMPRSGATRTWASALGNFRNINSHSGVSGYEGKNFGAAVGFDRSIGKNSLLGLALGYSTGDSSMDAGNGFYSAAKVDQDATLIGLYGLTECPAGGLRLSGFVTYGAFEQESDRYSTTTGRRAHTEWDADAWNIGATLSKDFELSGGSKLTPFVGVEYSYVSLDDATESGAYAARYREESAYQNLALKLGATLSRDIKLSQGTLTPYASVSYTGDALRRNAKLSATGLHGEEAGHSVKTSRNAVEFCVGGNWAITESWSAGASYSAELRDEATRQNINVNVGYSF
ncbi:MAG: autotransporter domain-containing protein [Akkermansia sp.]